MLWFFIIAAFSATAFIGTSLSLSVSKDRRSTIEGAYAVGMFLSAMILMQGWATLSLRSGVQTGLSAWGTLSLGITLAMLRDLRRRGDWTEPKPRHAPEDESLPF
jgi:hypothetical protein